MSVDDDEVDGVGDKVGGVRCIYYRRFRLTSVDTPFRGSSA